MKRAPKKARGSTSVERFVHFQCGSCKGWWGIGDAPKRAEWICPWCGLKQSFADKTPKVMKYR
ncbi:MAG: hypothetical protein KGI69_02775 [Patescibacteria group bacterium]|nr:hypothetical protein [Patescibacteria group bacterium]